MASWTGQTGNKLLKLQWEFYPVVLAMRSLVPSTTMQGKILFVLTQLFIRLTALTFNSNISAGLAHITL